LYFCPVVSFFFFYSSPHLSSCRLGVYHTSTHGVALVRIPNTGLKCAAHSSMEMLDAKKKSPKIRRLGTIAQLCRAISSQLRHVSKIGKELVKQQYKGKKKVKVGFLYSATYTANQNSALDNLRKWQLIGNSQWCCGAMRSIHCPR